MDGGSGGFMGDLEFVGGAIGMLVGNQQCVDLAMGHFVGTHSRRSGSR
jgi:hypothetical protein